MLCRDLTVKYHVENFEKLASSLSGYTDTCTISFLDKYKKTVRNMKGINPVDINQEMMFEIASKVYKIAKGYNIKVNTCCEEIDLSSIGIDHAR